MTNISHMGYLDGNIQENLLAETLVPCNLGKVKQVGNCIISIVGVTKQCFTNEPSFDNIKMKILDVMGSLSVLWMGLEGIKATFEETASVLADEFSRLVEKTVTMFGQASNSISYQRRFSILFNLVKYSRKTKSLLKDKPILLQKHDSNLFGKIICSHINETERKKGQIDKIDHISIQNSR